MKTWFAGVLALIGLIAVGTAVVPHDVPVQAAGPQAAPKTGQAALTAVDAQVNALLARMTLDEKIGQMTQAEQGELSNDLATLAAVKASGVPYVVVVLSGRPVILGDIATEAGAIVAAWWTGTEGQGVADILTGTHKPSGKLSFTWPKSASQLPINKHSKNAAEALYPYGHGLTY